jgi:hypothetical protein
VGCEGLEYGIIDQVLSSRKPVLGR